MSEGFWAKAVDHMSYLVNRSPSTTVDLQIPEEIWREESVNYSTLRIFDCLAYSLIDSQKWNKLESISEKYIFIGFTKKSRVLDFEISRQGAFLPAEMWYLTKNQRCKSQIRRIKYKVELQTFQQTLKKR